MITIHEIFFLALFQTFQISLNFNKVISSEFLNHSVKVLLENCANARRTLALRVVGGMFTTLIDDSKRFCGMYLLCGSG